MGAHHTACTAGEHIHARRIQERMWGRGAQTRQKGPRRDGVQNDTHREGQCMHRWVSIGPRSTKEVVAWDIRHITGCTR